MTASDSKDKFPLFSGIPTWVPLLAFTLLTFLIGAAGYAIFEQTKKSITEKEVQNLGAIADLKVAQIVAWREAHRRRAEFFLHGAMLPYEVDQWLHEGAPANERKQKILAAFGSMQREQGYKTVSLIDTKGMVLISTNGSYAPDTEEKNLAMTAMRSQRALFSDLHRGGRDGNKIAIDCVAPLMATDEKKGTYIVGALLFEIDPDSFLYPMIQSWPTQSPSAETLLTRRDGDHVLFLNEVRHKKDAALSLRIPLTNKQLPSAQAVLHQAKHTDGIDYRGVPVIAAIRGISDTPWFMVAKIDKAELFAPINTLKRWAAGLIFAFSAVGGALVFLWFKGHQARYAHLNIQHDAAVERMCAETETIAVKSELAATLDALPDLLFELDLDGCYFDYHSSRPELLVASPEVLIGKSVHDTLPPEAANVVMSSLREANETGHSRGGQIELKVPQGKMWFELSIARKPVTAGLEPRFIVLSRDITERKLAEEKLNQSYKELEKLTTHLEVVREDEQKRIARELHDEMGGVLAALNVNVSMLAAQIPAEMADIHAKAAGLEKLVAAGIQAMQRTVSELRPCLLEEVGLKFAIEKYVREFERNTEIHCDLRLPEEELTLDGNQSTAIFRIVQESLTNVAKHAKANRVSIVLSDWETTLILTIKDNGEGFNLNTRKAKSFGLLGIRERAALVGGKAEVTSAAGKGTTVRVSLPLTTGRSVAAQPTSS